MENFSWRIKRHYRGTGTFGLGGTWGTVTFALEKNYTMPGCLSFVIGMQKHLLYKQYCIKKKNIYNCHAWRNGSNSRSSYYDYYRQSTRSSNIRNVLMYEQNMSSMALSEKMLTLILSILFTMDLLP